MFHRRQASLKKLAAKQTRPVQPVAPRPEALTKSPCPSPGMSSHPSPRGTPPSTQPIVEIKFYWHSGPSLGPSQPCCSLLLWLGRVHRGFEGLSWACLVVCPQCRRRDGFPLVWLGPPPLKPPGSSDASPLEGRAGPFLSPPVPKHTAPAAGMAPAVFCSPGQCCLSTPRASEPSSWAHSDSRRRVIPCHREPGPTANGEPRGLPAVSHRLLHVPVRPSCALGCSRLFLGAPARAFRLPAVRCEVALLLSFPNQASGGVLRTTVPRAVRSGGGPTGGPR